MYANVERVHFCGEGTSKLSFLQFVIHTSTVELLLQLVLRRTDFFLSLFFFLWTFSGLYFIRLVLDTKENAIEMRVTDKLFLTLPISYTLRLLVTLNSLVIIISCKCIFRSNPSLSLSSLYIFCTCDKSRSHPFFIFLLFIKRIMLNKNGNSLYK